MRESIRDLEKRIAQLKREMPSRGFERHVSLLKSIPDLPADLQSPALTKLAATEVVQTIISFPPQIQRGRHYVPRQALLFTATDLIHLRASIWPDQDPELTYLQGCGLLYMEVKLLLLYGFLEIVAQGQDAPARLGMEFNTMAWYRLSAPLRQLLHATNERAGMPPGKFACSLDAQEAVGELPLKFSNGVKLHGLLPGEQLEALVFQPATSKRRLRFFYQLFTANTLLLLTTNYVVVIQEELNVAQGWIVVYIPRCTIAAMQDQPRGPWNELTIQLKRADQRAFYKLLLKSEAVDRWQMQWIRHEGQWQHLQPDV